MYYKYKKVSFNEWREQMKKKLEENIKKYNRSCNKNSRKRKREVDSDN